MPEKKRLGEACGNALAGDKKRKVLDDKKW
jgi:hypothetical protein